MSSVTSQPRTLPLQTRLAPVANVAKAARTVEVIFTTGAAVRRARFDGWDAAVPFDEVLLVTDEAVDLSRFKGGAPVLDSHRAGSTDAQLAVVDDAWLRGGVGYARIRFPSVGIRKSSDELLGLIDDKIVRNVSVGYAINRVRVVEPKKAGEVEQRIVERWMPYELSFVTVPADAGAQTRAHGMRTFPVTVLAGGTRVASAGIGADEAMRTRMRMRARAAGLPD